LKYLPNYNNLISIKIEEEIGEKDTNFKQDGKLKIA
jgi:hypothetical protein